MKTRISFLETFAEKEIQWRLPTLNDRVYSRQDGGAKCEAQPKKKKKLLKSQRIILTCVL